VPRSCSNGSRVSTRAMQGRIRVAARDGSWRDVGDSAQFRGATAELDGGGAGETWRMDPALLSISNERRAWRGCVRDVGEELR
jgi:hypothetical protein